MNDRVAVILMVIVFATLMLSLLAEVVYASPAIGEKYNRKAHFGHGWIDADRDCQDTRQEVLIRDSLVPVTLTIDGCRVLTGLWYCEYTDTYYDDFKKVQIEHRVPLKEAWISGADAWSKQRRVKFANDLSNPEHLIAVYGSANQSKGAKDPAKWMPDVEHDKYIAEWINVKLNYDLTFDGAEVLAIISRTKSR